MATIKSYTDLEQSKKLAKILPLESADMYYDDIIDRITGELFIPDDGSTIKVGKGTGGSIAAWSLTALLNVIPERIIKNHYSPNLQKEDCKYSIAYGDDELLCIADNPIDACYNIILKLHELKLL